MLRTRTDKGWGSANLLHPEKSLQVTPGVGQ